MSGRKLVLPAFKIITAGDMSQATLTSAITNIQYMDNVCLEADWTGTSPVGSLAVQGSASYAQDTLGNILNAGSWTAISLNPAASISGNSGSILIDLNQLSFPYIRVVFTKVSGVGTLNVYIGGKEV